MKKIIIFIIVFILVISITGINSYSKENNTHQEKATQLDTFNTAFYEIGNYFEYLYTEQILQYRTYRLVLGDTLINGLSYRVTKHYDPHYGSRHYFYILDEDLRLLSRITYCPMADSNSNTIEIGFNFPLWYSWKRCWNNPDYTRVIGKGTVSYILNDTTVLRYIDTRDTNELVPDQRRYVEKFGLYKWLHIIGPIQEILVGAVIDNVVYGSVTLNVKNQNTQIPSTFKLHQNYPNPFNSSTVIKFSTPTNQKLNFVIYDNLGREIKRVNGLYYPQGNHELTINGDDLTSGVYFYRVEAGEFIETKKMVLIK